MAKNRVANLQENRLSTLLATLELELTEIKSAAQTISGSSVVYFSSQTASIYDFSGTIPDPFSLGYGGKLFLITATAQTMSILYANAYVDLYTGSGHAPYTALNAMTDLQSGASAFLPNFTDAPNNTNDGTIKHWFCQINGDTTRTLSVKFRVEALDHATVTVVALN